MSAPPPPPALRLHGVSVRFGERTALHDLTLEVRAGEFAALTGPNGSGKTTLLRTALGLVRPDQGTVEIAGAGADRMRARERARRVAWVPQEEVPRDNIPVLDYVLFGRYAHLPPFTGESGSDRRRAREALADVELADRAASGVLELSGGERQRVLLARALVQDAPLLLLDEPTAHLDIGHELDLLARVRRLVTERGGAVLAAMHDLNLAARYADRVLVLHHGRLVDDGRPAEVLSEPLLREVWGVDAELRRDPHTGAPYLLPRLPLSVTPRVPPVPRGGVHVVGGGGAAGPMLSALVEEGYRVTAGVLHLLDSDAQRAEELGLVFAAEVPFAPIGEDARRENRRLLSEAQAVVITPFAVGPSNLANLTDLLPFVAGRPTFLLGGGSFASRDFTGGVATAAWTALERAGARPVAATSELLRQLAEALAAAPPATG